MITSLGIASQGLLDPGKLISLHYASQGLLRVADDVNSDPGPDGNEAFRRAVAAYNQKKLSEREEEINEIEPQLGPNAVDYLYTEIPNYQIDVDQTIDEIIRRVEAGAQVRADAIARIIAEQAEEEARRNNLSILLLLS